MNEIDKDKLIRAILNKKISKVIEILEEHPNMIDYIDDYYTPLILASESQFPECTEFLLDLGANPNIKNENNMTALMVASIEGCIKCVELLLPLDENINIQENETCSTSLMAASYNGHTEIVKLLLQAGANPNLQDDHDSTALMESTKEGHTECVKLLLQAGANPNIKDKYGNTAHDITNNEKIKKLLLKAMNLWSLMPLYAQSYKKDKTKQKLPTDLLRKTFEMLFSKKLKRKSKKKMHKIKKK